MTSRHALLISAAFIALAPTALAPTALAQEEPTPEQQADPDNGPYVGLLAGANLPTDQAFFGENSPFVARHDAGVGYLVGGVVGREFDFFGHDLRMEGEISFRDNDLNDLFVSRGGGVLNPGQRTLSSGSIKATSFMANLLYSPDWKTWLQPFGGAGFGVSIVEFDSLRLTSQSTPLLNDDRSTSIALQGIAGLETYLSDSLRLQIGYRYHATDELNLSFADGTAVQIDYEAHSAFLGLQWAFGGAGKPPEPAPAPAAPPAPKPNRAPSAVDDSVRGQAGDDITFNVLRNDDDPDGDRLSVVAVGEPEHGTVTRNPDGTLTYRTRPSFEGSDRFRYTVADEAGSRATAMVRLDIEQAELPPPFLVFFELDSATLTDSAKATIEEAVSAYETYGAITISATGHTDTTGPEWYNRRLANRRAEAVKAELAKFGIEENAVSVSGRGESEPLVPTGDGVLEPQNRRVEIELSREDD